MLSPALARWVWPLPEAATRASLLRGLTLTGPWSTDGSFAFVAQHDFERLLLLSIAVRYLVR